MKSSKFFIHLTAPSSISLVLLLCRLLGLLRLIVCAGPKIDPKLASDLLRCFTWSDLFSLTNYDVRLISTTSRGPVPDRTRGMTRPRPGGYLNLRVDVFARSIDQKRYPTPARIDIRGPRPPSMSMPQCLSNSIKPPSNVFHGLAAFWITTNSRSVLATLPATSSWMR